MRVPIFGIDLDGVVVNTYEPFLQCLSEACGRHCGPEGMTHYSFHDSHGTTEEEEAAAWATFHVQHRNALEFLPGAVKGIDFLASLGFCVALTSRVADWQDDTQTWATNNQLPFHLIGFSQTKVRDMPGLSLMIEDNGATALAFAEIGVPVLLFDYLYNRAFSHANIHRVAGWAEAISWIEERFPELVY